jgi:hypothetical protein
MNTKLTALSLAAIAFLSLGASISTASDRDASRCIEFTPELAMTMDAGGYSAATREHLTQSTAYFVAHIELPDGRVHPAFGVHPRGVYLFKTVSGRLVIRPMEIRKADAEWPLAN